jgi:hypothetical protein
VDKDTCGDPWQFDDGWCAAFSLSGTDCTFEEGHVTFNAPGKGTVSASVDDAGNPGCPDSEGPLNATPADYYVIGGPISCGKSELIYRCVPGNPDIAIMTAAADQPDVEYEWSVSGPATIHATVDPATLLVWADVDPGSNCFAAVTLTYRLNGHTCTDLKAIDIRKAAPSQNGDQGLMYFNGDHTYAELGFPPVYPCTLSDSVWGFVEGNYFDVFDQCTRPFTSTDLDEVFSVLCGDYPGATGGSTDPSGTAHDFLGIVTCDSTIFQEGYACALEQRWRLAQCNILDNCVQLKVSVVSGHESDDPMVGGVSYTAEVTISSWSGPENCPCP